jgi:tetratricopeptide (TPR) repeat protein
LLADNGETEEGIRTAQQAASYSQQALDRDPSNLEMRRGYSKSRGLLANVYLSGGRFEEMGRCTAEALSVNRQILADHPDDARVRSDYALSCVKHAEFLTLVGKNDEALRYHRIALREREALAEDDPHNSQVRRNVSYSHMIVGSLLMNMGEMDEARPHLQMSLSLDQAAVADDPSNAEARRDLGLSHQTLGNFEMLLGNHDDAIDCYERMHAIFNSPALDRGSASSAMRDLATATGKLRDAHFAKGDMASAGKYSLQILPILERLSDSDPSNVVSKVDLAAALDRYADILSRRGEKVQALGVFQRAADLVAEVVRADSTFKMARRNQAAACYQLASAHESVASDESRTRDERTNDWQSAATWYAKTIDVYDRLRRDDMVSDAEYSGVQSLRDALVRCRNEHEKLTDSDDSD